MPALIDARQVGELLKVKPTQAYKVIRELNKELADKGFLTVRGKVNENYLKERYGLHEKNQ